jgi:hypothetical protein
MTVRAAIFLPRLLQVLYHWAWRILRAPRRTLQTQANSQSAKRPVMICANNGFNYLMPPTHFSPAGDL